MSKDYFEASHIVWQGIEIEIRHYPEWCVYAGFDHLEVISKDRVPLPMTRTGYRSHFMPSSDIEPYGTVIDYVQAWLDHEGQNPAWKQHVETSKQLSLL